MVAILDRAHSCGVHHSSIKFVFIITHLKSIVCATPWLCLQLAFFKILNEAVTLGITKKPYQITKKKNCKSGLDACSGKFTMGYLNGARPSWWDFEWWFKDTVGLLQPFFMARKKDKFESYNTHTRYREVHPLPAEVRGQAWRHQYQ